MLFFFFGGGGGVVGESWIKSGHKVEILIFFGQFFTRLGHYDLLVNQYLRTIKTRESRPRLKLKCFLELNLNSSRQKKETEWEIQYGGDD